MFIARSVLVPAYYPGAEDGDIPGDPIYYQQLAKKQLQSLQTEGLQAFQLRPSGSGPAGIASLAYFAWNDPLAIVAINALLHAIGVTALLSLLLIWFSQRIALFALFPAFLSPYSMIWFSQLNKDSFVFAGSMLFSLGVARLVSANGHARSLLTSIFLACLGVGLIGLVRPYLNQILLVAILPMIAGMLVGSQGKQRWIVGFSFSVILLSLGAMSSGAASDRTLDDLGQFRLSSDLPNMPRATACLRHVDVDNWKAARLLPESVDEKLRIMAGQRCLILSILDNEKHRTTLSAFIDQDIFLNSSSTALAYVPRALQIGVFAPWPNFWLLSIEYRSPFYLFSSIEAAMLYLGLLALVICLIRMKNWSLYAVCYLAVVVSMVYGMTTPFLGALYRYRYPWWIMLICIGLASIVFVARRERSVGISVDRMSSKSLTTPPGPLA